MAWNGWNGLSDWIKEKIQKRLTAERVSFDEICDDV